MFYHSASLFGLNVCLFYFVGCSVNDGGWNYSVLDVIESYDKYFSYTFYAAWLVDLSLRVVTKQDNDWGSSEDSCSWCHRLNTTWLHMAHYCDAFVQSCLLVLNINKFNIIIIVAAFEIYCFDFLAYIWCHEKKKKFWRYCCQIFITLGNESWQHHYNWNVLEVSTPMCNK